MTGSPPSDAGAPEQADDPELPSRHSEAERPTPPTESSILYTARRRLLIVAALYPVVTLALWAASSLDLVHAGFLTALLLLVPALAVVQVPLAEADGEAALPRIPTYIGSAVVILVLGATATALGLTGFGVTAMGLAAVPPGFAVAAGFGLAAVTLLLIGLVRLLATMMGWADSPLLALLLPRTGRERVYFAGLSLAAGTGEELAYRSYAMAALEAASLGPWGAAMISSVAFGVLHSYQGRLGVARTGIIGFVLAASLVVSGSVWPAMIAHVLVDLVAGLVLGDRLLSAGRAPGKHRTREGDPRTAAVSQSIGGFVQIDLALLADAATVDGSGKLNILGVFDRISTGQFPAQHGRISLVLRFSAGLEQAGDHTLTIRLRSPKGDEMLRLDGQMKLGPGSPLEGGRLKVPHILNLDGIVFPAPGSYAFDVDVDGAHQVSLPLSVASMGFQGAAEA